MNEQGEWRADPSGRHEFRYWNGTQWTEHVSDQGRASVDASMEPTARPTMPAPPVAKAILARLATQARHSKSSGSPRLGLQE